jgi:hypothetical protein
MKVVLRSTPLFLLLLTLLGMFCLMTNAVFSQQYVNGNLSTGVNSSNGQAAPAGFTWSEVQTGNANAGFGANIAASLTLADDFTVNVATWTVTKMTFYGYSTGYSGATSPFNDLRLQIFNTDPSVGTPVAGASERGYVLYTFENEQHTE